MDRSYLRAIGFGMGLLLASTGDLSESGDEAMAQQVSTAKARPIVVGKVSDDPKKHYRYLKPMADYLAKHLRDLGITEGKVLMAKDNQQMIEYIRMGKVDLITETPFSAIVFHDEAEAELLLRKWKKGVPEYHTVIFVRNDSGIDSIHDLKGKTIAFEDPGSSSAFYIPAAVLLDAGMELTPLQSPKDIFPDTKIGYVFSGEEINTSTWVHKGIVSAGAYSNLDWEKNDHLPVTFRKDLKVIHQTKPFPRAIELVRKDLDIKVKERIKEVLLKSNKEHDAREILKAYQKTKKFDELDDKMIASLHEVRRLMRLVESSLQ